MSDLPITAVVSALVLVAFGFLADDVLTGPSVATDVLQVTLWVAGCALLLGALGDLARRERPHHAPKPARPRETASARAALQRSAS